MRDGICMWCFRFYLSFAPFIRFGMFFQFSSGGLWENGEGESGWGVWNG